MRILPMGIPITFILAGLATPSMAQVPDPAHCDAVSAGGHVLITPLGTSESLASAGATITVTIRDQNDVALAGIAANRITLGSLQPMDIVQCAGDNVAAGPTDTNGVTQFTGVLVGGGYTLSDLRVFVDGQPIASPLGIEVNGPDVTRDLIVDFADASTLFNDLLGGPFQFRSDLWRDDMLDIVDIAVFTLSFADVSPCAP